MPIYFYQGKILFKDGKIAMGPNCCCGAAECCCQLDPTATYYATFDAPGCSVLDNRVIEMVVTQNGGSPICQVLGRKNNEIIEDCTVADIPIEINLRCNLNLEVRAGEGPCDRYELELYYTASSCKNVRQWVRVEPGCSCSPLNLVFKMEPPQWSGIGLEDCDCCETTEDITVTITE